MYPNAYGVLTNAVTCLVPSRPALGHTPGTGHKLADLLFKVAALGLHSHVSRTVSFDEIGDAVNPFSKNAGRIVVLR